MMKMPKGFERLKWFADETALPCMTTLNDCLELMKEMAEALKDNCTSDFRSEALGEGFEPSKAYIAFKKFEEWN